MDLNRNGVQAPLGILYERGIRAGVATVLLMWISPPLSCTCVVEWLEAYGIEVSG